MPDAVQCNALWYRSAVQRSAYAKSFRVNVSTCGAMRYRIVANRVTLRCVTGVVCGACQSSLYNDTAVLRGLWSDYERTVDTVERLRHHDASLDVIRSLVDELLQLVNNDSTSSVHFVWNRLSDRLSRVHSSLQTTSTRVGLSNKSPKALSEFLKLDVFHIENEKRN